MSGVLEKVCSDNKKSFLFFQEVTEIVTVDVAVSNNNSFQYELYHITRV
jgi:hypothetical protein